ncbi:MAG: enoyl-CoA hydratase-related protein [Dehalococcoidales bacterium]|nr:enoyl-CoA hydratase-related protein [Dehalococcoidales bacterium]
MPTDYKEIIYSVDKQIATITLNRPETLNALTLRTHLELSQAIEEANNDEMVKVIVITGSGRGFCSGEDVKDVFLNPDADSWKGREVRLKHLQGENLISGGHRLVEINKPSIAAVNGPAVGYGCDLTLLCTMRIASDRAKFGEVFLRVGLIPDEALILLPRLVGLSKAYEMILTTDIIDAHEAEKIGLVNKVISHDELMSVTLELAQKIATKPPISVKLAMEGIRRGLNWQMREFMNYHSLAFSFCTETEDHQEGARAFIEKRQPRFKGK